MRAAKASGYAAVLDPLRAGPPPLPWRLPPVAALDILEDFVHHEDARRANGLEPRPPEPELDRALWRAVRWTGRWQLRRVRGLGVVAAEAGGREAVLRRGRPAVRISGRPGELLLYLYGRKQAARVALSGPPAAVEALSSARLRA